VTTALEILRWIALVFCGLSLLGLTLTTTLALAAPWLIGRRPRRSDLPPVSFVIPIKMFEPSFVGAQTSIFEQDYPEFDVTITAIESESTAVAAAREIIAAHPAIPARIVQATATFAASPKVNNMYQAVEDAPHDLIMTKDCNIELPPEAAREAALCMVEGVGLVTAVTEARAPGNFPAAIECALMNQMHARVLYAAAALGLGFGLGKLMVFHRSDLHRAGGFHAIAHSVGEDSAMAHALAKLGLRTVIMRTPIIQVLGERQFGDVFNRQLRWAVIRRHNELPAFLSEPLGLSSCAALAAALAAPLLGWSALAGAAATLGLWFAFETLLAFSRGWDVSMGAPATMIARDTVMLCVWLRAWFTRRVVWASEVYDAQRECGPLPATAVPVAPTSKRNDP
jgi:ceramide glucosyltransferase